MNHNRNQKPHLGMKVIAISNYQICTRCVMDTSDPDITFDVNGICTHCHQYDARCEQLSAGAEAEGMLEEMIDKIKRSGEGKTYDSILGLSGGVDSSHLAYHSKQLGLRPLAVHLDNGWDSELAINNIQNIVRKLSFDLHTHVVDWQEFRDLQRSFFKAHVIDIEMLTDHAIGALVYQQARAHKVRYILSGENIATESHLPDAWTHFKSDLRNIKSIHKEHGTLPLETFPRAGSFKRRVYDRLYGISRVTLLDLLHYKRKDAIDTLERELGWRPYGAKHGESLFTRFYQNYILFEKFGVDKRRAHLSSLICSDQVERRHALAELESLPYDPATIETDKEFVLKKLGFTNEEFRKYMETPPRSHFEYATDQKYMKGFAKLLRIVRPHRH